MTAILTKILLFFLVWALNALALTAVAQIVPGVTIKNTRAAVVGALVIGLVSWLVKPILVFFSLPALFLTFGSFYLVIMTLCFALAGWLTEGFVIDGALPAFLGALLMTVFSGLLGYLVPGMHLW